MRRRGGSSAVGGRRPAGLVGWRGANRGVERPEEGGGGGDGGGGFGEVTA